LSWSCFCDIPIFTKANGAPAARSTSSTNSSTTGAGYGSVYFVDDHFLLQPRASSDLQSINDNGINIQWVARPR